MKANSHLRQYTVFHLNLFLIFPLFFIFGCSKKSPKIINPIQDNLLEKIAVIKSQSSEELDYDKLENRAKTLQIKSENSNELELINIPRPIGSVSIDYENFAAKSIEDNLIKFKSSWFVSNLDQSKIIDFYLRSMELEGWAIDNFSSAEEGLLFCSTNTKKCAISIRAHENKSVFGIFYKARSPEEYEI